MLHAKRGWNPWNARVLCAAALLLLILYNGTKLRRIGEQAKVPVVRVRIHEMVVDRSFVFDSSLCLLCFYEGVHGVHLKVVNPALTLLVR